MGARPGVHFGLAHPAFETARMLVRVLFARGGVIHPATGAGEFFGGPDAACHGADYAPTATGFKSATPR